MTLKIIGKCKSTQEEKLFDNPWWVLGDKLCIEDIVKEATVSRFEFLISYRFAEYLSLNGVATSTLQEYADYMQRFHMFQNEHEVSFHLE